MATRAAAAQSKGWASEGLATALAALLPAAVWLWTAPRSVGSGDAGLLGLAAWAGGLAHPPGYPLWVGLAHGALRVPVGDPIVRIEVLDVVLGAMAVAVGHRVLVRLGLGPLAALGGALLWGFSRELWAASHGVEVYSLAALLFVTLLWLIPAEGAPGWGRATGLGVVLGLGISHHWPLLAMMAPMLVLWAGPGALRWGPRWLGIGGGAVFGLSPWAAMVMRSWSDPEISVQGPITSPWALWVFVSRQGFGVDHPWPHLLPGEALSYVAALVVDFGVQLGVWGGLLALAGVVLAPTRLGAGKSASLVAGVVVPVGAVAWVTMGNPGDLPLEVCRPFTILAVFSAVVFAALGLEALVSRWVAALPPAWAATGALVAGLPGALTLIQGFPELDRSEDRWVVERAEAILEALPQTAVLVVQGDVETGSIGWLHHVEGRRPDVRLVQVRGLVFRDRLAPAGSSAHEREVALAELISTGGRPVFATPSVEGPGGYVESGALRWLQPGRRGARGAAAQPVLVADAQAVLARPPRDRFEAALRGELLRSWGRTCSFLAADLEKLPPGDALGALCGGLQEDPYGWWGRVEGALLTRYLDPLLAGLPASRPPPGLTPLEDTHWHVTFGTAWARSQDPLAQGALERVAARSLDPEFVVPVLAAWKDLGDRPAFDSLMTRAWPDGRPPEAVEALGEGW